MAYVVMHVYRRPFAVIQHCAVPPLMTSKAWQGGTRFALLLVRGGSCRVWRFGMMQGTENTIAERQLFLYG